MTLRDDVERLGRILKLAEETYAAARLMLDEVQPRAERGAFTARERGLFARLDLATGHLGDALFSDDET